MTEYDLLKIISENIKSHRKQHGWTQAFLAEEISVSVPFLSAIETAHKWPSPKTMIKLAEAFNMNTYELLKPQNILPDTMDAVLDKFTAEMIQEVNSTIRQLHKNYLNLQIKEHP
ncbi:MAG: helix-turn-helix domain-containing protein [Spirochaetaceae bacterium]|jgi:transcriptional regulator with XRE-family HTH domain|nr:helix-turn-helix domain-containing protein [Spirochaetaceae bacterium]GMO21027.1 MAG: hypothetical protein Pg6A_08010 [Termitinemataceae bacterium]